MTDFIREGRLFRVTAFLPSHRQLFLTSPATLVDQTTTRVEVSIGHVELMFLKPLYRNGLHIRRATAEEFAVLGERHGIPEESAAYTWMLERDGDSFVVGANPSWREAEYELMGDLQSLYDAPSPPEFPMESGHVD
ncbi:MULTISPECIES: hypothetical protein [unclassified Streptomyces]|uniref:hypothetical protein n=1 Tax=unclassified Streptomyces TaxID=2593676 RepID=UPI0006F3FE16|nr:MULTISPECIES: hypothetical protein [unclassified Streptomyces]KQX59446.1 hypothetical protein ASD33_03990 [Streptomyces sp. Root1304]KRB00704.1 hypothetical protein ASE09_03995 [Streptomyces sp. Root66D1]